MGYNTKLEAVEAARITRKKMKTPTSWKIDVWENLGWHYHLTNGTMQLYERDGEYAVLFGLDDATGGEVFWTPGVRHFRNPNNAVRHQISIAQAFVNRCSVAINGVKL